MEKLKNNICTLLPHSCNNGIAEPKGVVRPETRLPETETHEDMNNKPVKKPWSVYEGVYWI